MSKYVPAKVADVLKIKNRKVNFSFWPMGKGKRHEKLHSILFASDPWRVIERQIRRMDESESSKFKGAYQKLTNHIDTNNFDATSFLKQSINFDATRQKFITAEEKKQNALHFLRQGEDFFKAMENSDTQAAKPLLLYYSFLNLAKCFIVFKKKTLLDSGLYHGLTENSDDEKVKIKEDSHKNVFRRFSAALLNKERSFPDEILQKDLLSQILIGHRFFCQSQGANFKEKFISLEEIHFRQDRGSSTLWLLARAARHDFHRIDQNIGDFAKSLNPSSLKWKNVNEQNTGYEKDYVFAEVSTPQKYKQKPSFILNELCQKASLRLWRSVTSHPPYRKYYIYIPDDNEELLPQLLSIYLATFYFGSITRYKPSKFNDLLEGEMGAFIHEFFASQPKQFLYLMASEFMEQEVTNGAVV